MAMASDDRAWEVRNIVGNVEARHATEAAAKRHAADRVAHYQTLAALPEWKGLEVPTFDVVPRPAFEVASEIWFENLYHARRAHLTATGLPSAEQSGYGPADGRKYVLRSQGGARLGEVVFNDESRGEWTP
jgi:hypothetical protein